MPVNDEVLTTAEVAAMLKVHVKTVLRLAKTGELPSARIGHSLRYSRREIEAVLRGAGKASNGKVDE